MQTLENAALEVLYNRLQSNDLTLHLIFSDEEDNELPDVVKSTTLHLSINGLYPQKADSLRLLEKTLYSTFLMKIIQELKDKSETLEEIKELNIDDILDKINLGIDITPEEKNFLDNQ